MTTFDGFMFRTRTGRRLTKHQEFAQKYNLGNPEFGNFFVAQYDEYVPVLDALLDSYVLAET